jgi:hypothetical protein
MVTLHAQSVDANIYGEWSVWLQPEQAGGPYTLTVSGTAPDNHPLSITDGTHKMPVSSLMPDAPQTAIEG